VSFSSLLLSFGTPLTVLTSQKQSRTIVLLEHVCRVLPTTETVKSHYQSFCVSSREIHDQKSTNVNTTLDEQSINSILVYLPLESKAVVLALS
jgi:hypothetical protein